MLGRMSLRPRLLLVALALLSAAAALPSPAQAQFWGFGNEQPARRSDGFFSFPFFERGQRSPYGAPYGAPVEPSRAPAPRKLETPPAHTIVVIGDSLADWLAYGLEEIYADQPDFGVVRKIRPNSGLVHYEPRNDALEWSQAVKDILADEKPSAIVVMLGLNDRVPLRIPARPRENAPRKGEPAAQAGNAKETPQNQEQKPAEAAQASAPAGNPPGEQAPVVAEAGRPGALVEFHSEPWAQLYGKRIGDMIAALKAKGVPILWVGLPAVRGPRSTADMGYLDDLYHAAADKAGIRYVDIWDGFVDENGRYSVQGPDFEGQTRRLRSGDGVHFTKYGALKLAHLVDQDLSRVLTNPAVAAPAPAPEAAAPAKAGAAKPAVGPVLPLTADGGGQPGDLLGGSKSASPSPDDSVAASVLVRGDALAAPPGRADNFAWPPRGGAGANPAPAAAATPTPAAAAH
jgi:uncharacterized protein